MSASPRKRRKISHHNDDDVYDKHTHVFSVASDQKPDLNMAIKGSFEIKEVLKSRVFRIIYPEELRCLLDNDKPMVHTLSMSWLKKKVGLGYPQDHVLAGTTVCNFLGVDGCTEKYRINIPFLRAIDRVRYTIMFDHIKPSFVDKRGYFAEQVGIDPDSARIVASFECPKRFYMVGVLE